MKAVVFITVVGLLPTLLAEMIPFEDCSRQEEVAVKVHGVGLVPKVPKGGSTVEVIVRSRASKSRKLESFVVPSGCGGPS